MEAAWAHGLPNPFSPSAHLIPATNASEAQAFRQVAYQTATKCLVEAFPALGALAFGLPQHQHAALHLQTAGSQEAAGGCSGYWLLARTTVEAKAAASYSGYRLLDMSFLN